ncbi:putative lipid II flippase FtsW [Desulfovibrio sp. JC022]|uniref:putative lipid II flippase FtsW n=1 Tax=Desulfovibrio sp. JC022 TaxID=2593642 RepID=UPI0013D5BAD2|nr:putative lipid II flippase FtsW [Desulfovibrio sp. JC022]NDV21143.1 putative lipid II flippase FtsW [Desulfovibrio sp. JC022]
MNKKKNLSGKPERLDYWLLAAALLLACFGLMMVLSASGIMAERFFDDKYLFFKKQAVFLVAGTCMMYICSRLPKAFFYNMVYVWLMAAFVLLLLCDFSPLSVAAGGAKRWIALGPLRIQPLEFCKPALVLYLAYFFSRKQELIKTFSVGFLPPYAITGALCLLLMMQPDFGGSVFLCMILFFMSLVGGTRVSYLLTSLVFAGGAGYMLITSSPYRLKRMTAFIDPFKSAHEEGYQLVQSLYAFGSGNVFGQGLGAGKQKLFFLPEAHNDFIMAVVGEELGFIGVLAVFAVIGFLVWRGFKIALSQDDLQDRFTAYGLTIMLALGFSLNLAVVMGTVPPKGVPMPFVSYGGSSLMVSCICTGILLNLSRGKV